MATKFFRIIYVPPICGLPSLLNSVRLELWGPKDGIIKEEGELHHHP